MNIKASCKYMKLWNLPTFASFSMTQNLSFGWRIINSLAVAKPTIPAPTMTTSYSLIGRLKPDKLIKIYYWLIKALPNSCGSVNSILKNDGTPNNTPIQLIQYNDLNDHLTVRQLARQMDIEGVSKILNSRLDGRLMTQRCGTWVVRRSVSALLILSAWSVGSTKNRNPNYSELQRSK